MIRDAGILTVFLATVLFGSGASAADPAPTKLFLEVDIIKKVKPLKMKVFKDKYEGVGFRIEGDRKTNDTYLPPGDCVPISTLHDWLVATKNVHLSPSVWYAHGLLVPYEGVWVRDELGCLVCLKYKGWQLLLPQLANDRPNEVGHRESFVVFDKKFAPGEEQDRAYTAVHELGHVMNLHHCEYDLDGWERYDIPFGRHITEHLAHRHKEENHVKPRGELWCGGLIGHHRSKHHRQTQCCARSRCCGLDCAGIYDYCHTASLQQSSDVFLCDSTGRNPAARRSGGSVGAVLHVESERQRYFPGEPIHVNLRLALTDPRADLRYAKNSMNTMTNNLFFSVGKSRDSMQRLRMPLLAEGDQALAPLRRGVPLERSGVGFWFSLSPEWYEWEEGRDVEKVLWLGVSYKLFEPDGRGGFRHVLVHSDPLRITIGIDRSQPGLFDATARELFTHWQARRFVWLGGSHVLPQGKANLERIVRDYPQTIYAQYAGLALNQRCDPPPLTRDPRRRRIRRCQATLKKLQEAQRRFADLPPSYVRMLNSAITEVEAQTK